MGEQTRDDHLFVRDFQHPLLARLRISVRMSWKLGDCEVGGEKRSSYSEEEKASRMTSTTVEMARYQILSGLRLPGRSIEVSLS